MKNILLFSGNDVLPWAAAVVSSLRRKSFLAWYSREILQLIRAAIFSISWYWSYPRHQSLSQKQNLPWPQGDHHWPGRALLGITSLSVVTLGMCRKDNSKWESTATCTSLGVSCNCQRWFHHYKFCECCQGSWFKTLMVGGFLGD